MDKPKIRPKHGPEYGIQKEIIRFLRLRGWWVERLVGLAWQSGLPDLFACHKQHGFRFIEVKYEDKFYFTQAQKCKFPCLMANGAGIWVMTAANDEQYDRLFDTPNVWDYLDKKDCPTEELIDTWLDELNNGD
jgi:hypothetical protein